MRQHAQPEVLLDYRNQAAVVNINYPLAPAARMKEIVNAVRDAVVWVRGNASRWTFIEAWQRQQVPVADVAIPGKHHFNVIDDLGRADTTMFSTLWSEMTS